MRAFFHGILSQARKLERVKHRVCPNHTFTQILAYHTPVLSEKNTSTSTKFPLWSFFFFSHVCSWTLFVGCFFFSFIYLLASLFFVSCCLFPLFLLKTNHCPNFFARLKSGKLLLWELGSLRFLGHKNPPILRRLEDGAYKQTKGTLPETPLKVNG